MLSDDEIDAALKTEFQSIVALIDAEITAGQFKVELRRLARAVERAAYERAAQECIETAAELRRCADGCTDGRYDWKADGADDCADAIRALGRQHD